MPGHDHPGAAAAGQLSSAAPGASICAGTPQARPASEASTTIAPATRNVIVTAPALRSTSTPATARETGARPTDRVDSSVLAECAADAERVFRALERPAPDD